MVTVGTLMWSEGAQKWALQAIRRVSDAGINVQFEIIGDGPDRQRVLYTIADLGLGGHVRLVGKLSPGQVLVRVQQADAFLLPSLSEGISNAVLEAMACGVPVVTTECGGMREAVTDGVEGLMSCRFGIPRPWPEHCSDSRAIPACANAWERLAAPAWNAILI